MKMNGERVILNVRGRKFETSKETFQRIPESRLYKLISNSVSMEYYFDRNSILFEYILDVYKTGALHVPNHLCGGLLKQEMQYWGIPLHYIANCCLKNYSAYLDELRIIKEIEKAFANDYEEEPEQPFTTPRITNPETEVYFKNDSFESDDDSIASTRSNNNTPANLLKKAMHQNRHASKELQERQEKDAKSSVKSHLEIPETVVTGAGIAKTTIKAADDYVMINIPLDDAASTPNSAVETTPQTEKSETSNQAENINTSSSNIVPTIPSSSPKPEVNGKHIPEAPLPSVSGLHSNNESDVLTNIQDIANKLTKDLNQSSKPTNFKRGYNKKHLKAAKKIIQPNRMSLRARIRQFLEDPFSSKLAFVWGCAFLAIVIMSVIIQCCSSHPYFRKHLEPEDEETTSTSVQSTPAEDWDDVQEEETTSVNPTKVSNGNHSDNTLLNDGYKNNILTSTVAPIRIVNNSVSCHVHAEPWPYKEKMYRTTALLPVLKYIQQFCVIVFTVELLLRLAVSVNKKRFLTNIYNIVDFLALIPTAIIEVMDLVDPNNTKKQDNTSFVFLGTMGVFKTLRLVKFIRHYRAMKILLLALKASIQEILLLFLLISIGMLIFSTLIYYTEFYTKDFETIPIGFWWSIVTMTTVGYGDIHPSTGWGYLVGTMCALAGMLSTGLPIPIIANNFNIYYTYAKVHTCKIEIAARDSNMKFSKVVRIIGRISTTIKKKEMMNKAANAQESAAAPLPNDPDISEKSSEGIGSQFQQQ